MHELALEQRRTLGLRATWHVGDVSWNLRQHEGREREWDIRVWRDDDGRVAAWSWLLGPGGELELDIRRDRLELLEEILADPRVRHVACFEDDAELRAAYLRHGFVSPGQALHYLARDVPEPPAMPPLAEGFRCRTVDESDLAERVAAHRDAFAPSRVTESSYTNVRRAWPYRSSLDCVVEAPDGRFAAYCLVWPDDENGVGELEPVGTRTEFRRRGLGAAVCTFALRRLHEEGIRQAIVYCVTEQACALYESLGFRRHATQVAYSRQPPG